VVSGNHVVDVGSVSALSESVSKSACTFPMMSSAAFVFLSSLSRRALRRFNCSVSDLVAPRFARRSPFKPARDPASRARLHSVMCELYEVPQ
jgi:hypothetical protein